MNDDPRRWRPDDAVGALIGRRRELAEARRRLRTSRLVTFTGVGGSGKSSLARQTAADLATSYADGVRLVDLAALTDGALLDYHLASALGIQHHGSRSPSEIILDQLSHRTMLLVLDNCEHLLDETAAFVHHALRAAAGLRVLCTSRQPVGIVGEQLLTVPPLAVPDLELRLSPAVASRSPAVALFVNRAAERLPGFSVTTDNYAAIVAICRQLDGLPLAIELAAAHVATAPMAVLAAELADRLARPAADRPPPEPATDHGAHLARHSTLQTAFDWGFALCGPAERALWGALSIFEGSFDPDAVAAVCTDPQSGAGDLSAHLSGLVDKSILLLERHPGTVRYRLLDTLRRYGRDRLRTAGDHRWGDEAVLRQRHLAHYRALAEHFDANWFGPRQSDLIAGIRTELPNLRAALASGLADADGQPAAVAIAGALDSFWFASGALREGRHWLRRTLAADTPPTPSRLRALAAYSRLLIVQGEHEAGMAQARHCLVEAERARQPRHAARALAEIGLGLAATGDAAAALPVLNEALDRLAKIGDRDDNVAANAHMILGMATLAHGDPDRALARFADLQRRCRQRGEQWWLGNALNGAALAALALGDAARATGLLHECLPIRFAVGDQVGIAMTIETLAWVAAADRDHLRAARLTGTAHRRWKDVGVLLFAAPYLLRGHERCADETRHALGADRYTAEFRRGTHFTDGATLAYAVDPDADFPPVRRRPRHTTPGSVPPTRG